MSNVNPRLISREEEEQEIRMEGRERGWRKSNANSKT